MEENLSDEASNLSGGGQPFQISLNLRRKCFYPPFIYVRIVYIFQNKEEEEEDS